MSIFSRRFPRLRVGEYEEMGIPSYVLDNLASNFSVRMFATPSTTEPNDGYYLCVVKDRRAGWSNGTAIIFCSCLSAMFKGGLIMGGLKTPCKHAKGLRKLLHGRFRRRGEWAKCEDE